MILSPLTIISPLVFGGTSLPSLSTIFISLPGNGIPILPIFRLSSVSVGSGFTEEAHVPSVSP